MTSRPKHLLKHPFYLACARELSKKALARFMRGQYYRNVARFRHICPAAHANCDDQAKRTVLSNLIDEEAGSTKSSELWKQFTQGLGVNDIDLARMRSNRRRRNDETFRSVCGQGSTAEVGALCVREPIPSICESKIDA